MVHKSFPDCKLFCLPLKWKDIYTNVWSFTVLNGESHVTGQKSHVHTITHSEFCIGVNLSVLIIFIPLFFPGPGGIIWSFLPCFMLISVLWGRQNRKSMSEPRPFNDLQGWVGIWIRVSKAQSDTDLFLGSCHTLIIISAVLVQIQFLWCLDHIKKLSNLYELTIPCYIFPKQTFCSQC